MSTRGRTGPEAIRERILDAAVTVLQERGEVGATTREIARAAGCSEGSLYTYFKRKEDLLQAVMIERLPPFIQTLQGMPQRAGEETLQAHLTEIARIALPFYVKATPMIATVLSSPELKEQMRRQNMGPHLANAVLATYLRLEQRLGRIRPEVSVDAAAALLLGACQQRAINMQHTGQVPDAEDDQRFVAEIVEMLLHGMDPASE